MTELKELVAIVVEHRLDGNTQAEKFDSLKQIISVEYHIKEVLNQVAKESHETFETLYHLRFIGYKK